MKNKFTLYHTVFTKLFINILFSILLIFLVLYIFSFLLVFFNIINIKFYSTIFFIIILLLFSGLVFKKSSKKMLIEIENKNITIDNNIILFENIKSIYMQHIFLRNFPKFIIKTKDNKKYKYRLNRGDADFFEFENEISKYIKEFDNKKVLIK